MDDDLIMNGTIIDLDLNLEPTDSSSGSSLRLWSLLDELENAHDQIEERIRQLEAVTARARQRQRMRNTAIGETISFHVSDPSINSQQEAATEDRGKTGKRDRACLVAEALGLNTIPKINGGNGGGFFDCNVCFDMAKEPILTSCGHLFCWACFHQLPYVYSTAKECPSCKGEIAENRIVPIYGNGSNCDADTNLGFGLRIPPRPKASRVESLREQRESRRASHIPVAAALRRIRMGIESNGSSSSQIRHLPNLTSLSESAASVSTISSALNSAERLVEDLESYLHNRILRRTDSDVIFPVNNIEGVIPGIEYPVGMERIEYPVGMERTEYPVGMERSEPSDEEQFARMITNAGAVSLTRVALRIPEVAEEEDETSHDVQRRRLM